MIQKNRNFKLRRWKWCCLLACFMGVCVLLWHAISRLQLEPYVSDRYNDTTQLIDLHDFEYRIKQWTCAPHIEALILVPSAPHNFNERFTIRNTWGGELLHDTPLRLIFLMGAVESAELQEELLDEQAHYGDVLQGSFLDNYDNMTYKHVMALKWFVQHCAQAQLLFKVDDDMYLNTPLLLQYLQRAKRSSSVGTTNTTHATSATTTATNHTADTDNDMLFSSMEPTKVDVPQWLFGHPQNLLLCGLKTQEKIIRHAHKWFVSQQEFPGFYYPPHCAGYAIIYSADVVARLYAAAQRTKFFWIDDVHVTGTLARRCGINVTSWYVYMYADHECTLLLKSRYGREFLIYFITDSLQVLALWKLHLDSQNIAAQNLTLPFAFDPGCGFIDFV